MRPDTGGLRKRLTSFGRRIPWSRVQPSLTGMGEILDCMEVSTVMRSKYFRLFRSGLRGRDPFFNILTLVVLEILALAYAATILAHAAGTPPVEHHERSPATIAR